jgi:hypothetical protein
MRRLQAGGSGSSTKTRVPLFGGGITALALAFVVASERDLAAGLGPQSDWDGDFLVDEQEMLLGTSPLNADSDGDGFTDLEELARGTSPIDGASAPTGSALAHLGMAAHVGADDKIHVLVAVHLTSANPRAIDLGFGIQVNRRVVTFSDAWVATHSTQLVTTGSNGQDLLHLFDFPIDASSMLAVGQLTFFATVRLPGGEVLSADTVRFLNIDGIVVHAMSPRPSSSSPNGGPMMPGTIYVPLPTAGSGGIPASWSSGEVCFQRSMPVAVNGSIVTQEIISASCASGWDGYCPPTCSASVGQTYTTVDPIVLLGG